MIEYFLPGLDASTLSDQDFIKKAAYLMKIRSMEQESELSKIVQLFTGK